MIKLLIISDDFTGALDTGVQMAGRGISTYVTFDRQLPMEGIRQGTDVLVIDTETRHLKEEEAYRIVSLVVKKAREMGIQYIYKKTDSVLRGNIGAELAAVLDAGEAAQLHFIPAYPQMGRVTAGGIQYVYGIPIAESFFGKDLFEPVIYSDVREIIAQQSKTGTVVLTRENMEENNSEKGIVIYDSENQKDFEKIAGKLKNSQEAYLIAGCAGFAGLLPDILGLKGNPPQRSDLAAHMLVACGSINPVSVAQCEYAEKNGAVHFRLTPQQKLSREWAGGNEAEAFLKEIETACKKEKIVLLNTNSPHDPQETDYYIEQKGFSREQVRTGIVSVMGILLERLITDGMETTILMMGGDLLYQFIRQAEISQIEPVCELETGVVLSRFLYRGRILNVISKSGGFGNKDLFLSLSERIKKYQEERKDA